MLFLDVLTSNLPILVAENCLISLLTNHDLLNLVSTVLSAKFYASILVTTYKIWYPLFFSAKYYLKNFGQIWLLTNIIDPLKVYIIFRFLHFANIHLHLVCQRNQEKSGWLRVHVWLKHRDQVDKKRARHNWKQRETIRSSKSNKHRVNFCKNKVNSYMPSILRPQYSKKNLSEQCGNNSARSCAFWNPLAEDRSSDKKSILQSYRSNHARF